jgi:hypothetical protein
MLDEPVLIHIRQRAFMEWLSRGIQPIATLQASGADDGSDQLTFHCCLPSKYGVILNNGESPALIDEVTGISLNTIELTDEWRIRFSNLGEAWLPFCFSSQWCGPAPDSLVEVVRQKENASIESQHSTETSSTTVHPPQVDDSNASIDSPEKRSPKKRTRTASEGRKSSKKSKTTALSVPSKPNLFSEEG